MTFAGRPVCGRPAYQAAPITLAGHGIGVYLLPW